MRMTADQVESTRRVVLGNSGHSYVTISRDALNDLCDTALARVIEQRQAVPGNLKPADVEAIAVSVVAMNWEDYRTMDAARMLCVIAIAAALKDSRAEMLTKQPA